ncbi:MAG: RDD family protein [Bacteroidetes bacterium]|nr:MAG: RDD family protein [Bacteroidota bacterium]
MKPFLLKPISEYTDDQLYSMMYNPRKTNKRIIQQVFDELKNRGNHEKAEKIENDLIKLKPLYSNFWTRLLAFVIDKFILGVGGGILGLVFRDFFAQLAQHGVLVGFFISWVYFGLLNSKLTGGQTPGKMALNIRVTDADGNPVQPGKSFLRALVYIFPLYLLNYSFGIPEGSVFNVIWTVLVGSLLFMIPIHMLLNKPVYQAIHDIMSGTFVIRTEAYQRQEYLTSPLRRIWIAGGVALVVIVAGITLTNNWKRGEIHQTFAEMRALQKEIRTIEDIAQVIVSKGRSITTQTGVDGSVRHDFLTIKIWTTGNYDLFGLAQPDLENDRVLRNVVTKVLNEYPDVDQLSQIRVNIAYGYNIGIARSSRSITLIKSPEDWRSLLYQ